MSSELGSARQSTKQMRDVAHQDSDPDLPQEEVRAKQGLISRIIERFRTLLRIQGLSALSFHRHGKDEPPKVLFTKSRWLTLAHCTIHFIPFFVSIALSAINLKGYFIGSELQGLENSDDMKEGFLQVAAKVQELLVVASLGSIIFHILRSELVFGEGVPLGLLVSGWNFSQIQYFWSAEFAGGLRCKDGMDPMTRWKRGGICLFVIIAGLLALFAGPVAALLMIPRKMDWPVGGGIYWLNGSQEQLWPTILDSDYYSDANCSQGNQFLDNRCPAAGFTSLHQYYTSWWNANNGISFELRDTNIRKMMYSRPALKSEANTWAFTSHSATATLQDAVRGLHRDALDYLEQYRPRESPWPRHLVWANPIRFTVETKVPAVRVLCQPQGLLSLWGEELMIDLPSISELDDWWDVPAEEPQKKSLHEPKPKLLDVLSFVRLNLASRGLIDNSSSLLDSRIFEQGRRTLILPIDTKLTNNSADLIVLLGSNWSRDHNGLIPPSNVLSCSIDARWVSAITFIETRTNYQLSHEYHLGRVRNSIEVEGDHLQRTLGYVRFKPPTNGSWPTVRLSPDWFDLMAPTLPDEPLDGMPWLSTYGSNQTSLEALFNMIYNPEGTSSAEFENLIATTVADGLSRSGLIPNYNGSRFLEAWPFGRWSVDNEDLARTMVRKGEPKESFSEPSILKPNSTRMVMKASYHGYVMEATSWFDYLMIAALLSHALIAFIHCLILLYSRVTSNAWDSILELVVLSHQSEPPPESLLANTLAGVITSKVVQLVASVEATHNDAIESTGIGIQPKADLQLRLRKPGSRRNSSLQPPQIGRAYGSQEISYV